MTNRLSRSGGGVNRTPWTLAASQDLAYPQTQGERPADLAEGAQYVAALESALAPDPVLPPAALLATRSQYELLVPVTPKIP